MADKIVDKFGLYDFDDVIKEINEYYQYDKIAHFTDHHIFSSPHKPSNFAYKFKKFMREVVYYKCVYCGADLPTNQHASIDHMKPKTHGGTNSIMNLTCCCKKCNTTKNNYGFERFRIMLALQNRGLNGIISYSQAKKLADAGVDLGIEWDLLFHFEFERIYSI